MGRGNESVFFSFFSFFPPLGSPVQSGPVRSGSVTRCKRGAEKWPVAVNWSIQ